VSVEVNLVACRGVNLVLFMFREAAGAII